jgi:tRNA dimethylallyltransferase
VPILVGGSALYVRAIVVRVDFPGTDPDLRSALEADLARDGAERLHQRLAALDPEAAAAIEPANGRRIVRALEVGALTGAPYRARLPERTYVLPGVRQVGLDLDRLQLDARIAQRVDLMWAAGFVDEVRALAAAGLRAGVTASRALGYRQVLEFLDGERTEREARDATIYATRRFARRQDSWFRKDERITWVSALGADRVESTYRLVQEV